MKRLTILTFLLSSVAFATGPGGKGGRFAHLDLTEEQRSKLVEVKKSNRQFNHERKGKIKDLRFKLGEILSSKNADLSKAKTIAEEIAKLTRERLLHKIDFVEKVRNILTKEQLDKVNFEMFFNNKHGRGGRKARGMGRGQAD